MEDLLIAVVGKSLNWGKIGRTRPAWIDYKQLKTMYLDAEKKVSHVRKTVQTLYGVKWTDSECMAFL